MGVVFHMISGSGVATVTRSVDGGSSTTGAAPASFTVSGDSATHSVAHSSTDVAGNPSVNSTQTLKIDATPPTISGAAFPAPNAAGWNNSNVTVAYSAPTRRAAPRRASRQ